MKKTILSIVAGVIVGWITVFVLESLTHLIYPPPEGVDMTNMEAVKEMIAGMPTLAMILILVAWLISAFVGGLVSAKIDKPNWCRNSLIVGGVLLLGAIINMYMIPHPTWMIIVAVVGYIPSAFLGAKSVSE